MPDYADLIERLEKATEGSHGLVTDTLAELVGRLRRRIAP